MVKSSTLESHRERVGQALVGDLNKQAPVSVTTESADAPHLQRAPASKAGEVNDHIARDGGHGGTPSVSFTGKARVPPHGSTLKAPRVVHLPPRVCTPLPIMDLQRALNERNAPAIADLIADDPAALTTAAKAASAVGARLNDKLESIVRSLPKSSARVSFVVQTLSLSGRLPMPAVMALALGLDSKEQAAVLSQTGSSKYLRTCGFGSEESRWPDTESAASNVANKRVAASVSVANGADGQTALLHSLLETPSGRPDVDARIAFAMERGFSFAAVDGLPDFVALQDPEGAPIVTRNGPLNLSLQSEQWPLTAQNIAAATTLAHRQMMRANAAGASSTVCAVLENARSAGLVRQILEGLRNNEDSLNQEFARLKDEVVDEQVPKLQLADFELVEPSSLSYNCVAHTVGISDRWIFNELGPDGKGPQLAELDGFYRSYGFAPDHGGSPKVEAGIEKILVYGMGKQIAHVAVLKDDGFIYSKLGMGALIRHRDPEVLLGSVYGTALIGCYRRGILSGAVS